MGVKSKLDSLSFVKEFMRAESQRKIFVFNLTEMLMVLKVSVYKKGEPKSCCETRGIDIQKAGAETNIKFSVSGVLSALLKAKSKLCISNEGKLNQIRFHLVRNAKFQL